MVYLWYTYGIPMVYLWYAYGMPMVCLWYAYGIPMVYLWYTYGIPIGMVYLWDLWYTYGIPMVYPQTSQWEDHSPQLLKELIHWDDFSQALSTALPVATYPVAGEHITGMLQIH